MEIDSRLDLISFASGVRLDPDTAPGDADLMAFLIAELCDRRTEPVAECLTLRRIAVLRRHDPSEYDRFAHRHGWLGQNG